MAAPTSRARIAPLDCLRVVATALVVLLHACVPYATHSMPGLSWPVKDQTSRIVDAVFWGTELFVMPLFLVMAGFFAVGLYRQRGGWGLVRHRFRGLMGPFAFAAVFLLPLSLYAWLTGWLIEGNITPRKMRSLAFDGGLDDDLWGFAHLWFLPYLFLYICLFAAIATIYRSALKDWLGNNFPRTEANELMRRGSLAGFALIAIGIVCCVPEVVFGFQHGFLPYPSKWVYCGTFFFGGVWLGYFDRELHELRRLAPRYLLVGGIAGVTAVLFGTRMLAGADDGATRLLMAVSTVLAAWSITLGMHGWVLRRQLDGGPVARYLAAASFWIYLSHHCVVALMHIDLKVMLPESSPLLKAALAFSVTTGVCLLMFEACVRRTWVGRLLGVKSAVAPTSGSAGSRSQGPAAESMVHPIAPAAPLPSRKAA